MKIRVYNKEVRRRSYLKFREKNKKYSKEYSILHPEIYRKSTAKYREKTYRLVLELKDKPCMDCGIKFPACAMDFDHIRGKKSFSLNSMYSEKRILEEVSKCDLVCANCHRIRTANRNKTKNNAEIVV
jgi:hypothetical protein